jgi:hypothetical protein
MSVVTFLFTDIEGSTRWDETTSRHHHRVRCHPFHAYTRPTNHSPAQANP